MTHAALRHPDGVDGGASRHVGTLPTIAPLGVALAAAGTAAYVVAVDPSGDGGLTPCPVRELTGWWCPGCGLTRAVHHLGHGDLAGALSYNVFVVPVVVSLIALWWVWYSVATGRGVPRFVTRMRPAAYVAAATALSAFVVVRNLPSMSVLRGG